MVLGLDHLPTGPAACSELEFTMTDGATGPQDLLEGITTFDMFSQDYEDRKWELFDFARGGCPVAHTDAGGLEFFVLSRYDDIRQVLEDWETWSSTEESPVNPGTSLCPIDIDPPTQTAIRKLLNPLFAKSALSQYEPAMHEAAQQQIGTWIDHDSVDILNEYAGPYIGSILTKIIFNDMSAEDLERATGVTHRIAQGLDAFAELQSLAVEYLEKARRRPKRAEPNVMSALLSESVDGYVLTEEDRAGMISILVLGGLDTSRAAIGHIVARMALDPSIEPRLRNPNWVKRDFDEFLRLDSPVGGVARVATRDTEIRGVRIRKGQRVQIRFDAANRDPEKFSKPHELTFDVIRSGHAAFGFGVHRCVGSNLARMQLEIGFQELLQRVTNFRLAPGQELRTVPGPSNALHPFRVEFDKR
jgi:cytochrome P450